MAKKRLGIDQDNVIADLLSEWVSRYNSDFDDNLTPEQVSCWNWHHLCKPECGTKIYEYLDDPDLFLNLSIMEGSQEVLRELSYIYDIYVVSAAYNPMNIPAKHTWLKKHFPFLNEKKFVFTRDKSIVMADYLIDDKPKNLEAFHGTKILYTAPHNHDEERFYRVNNWDDVREILLDWK
ncbi:5'(3')-deoxyribonucleotidase [Paenibacillus sp. ISL-20]|uniref:5' nucleotidase, NT5C type n=1 Tax=Paenibacillus sp. ISL-20 TaxID=2819163 RepID=UPI001BE85998|nr:5'(3')-deoxyribonucleotidase [Paenibacillus sp. ISL-20]MBT2759917.1 5'(3')-deoxyribonucleotidase [Paenibacillus sp. ISL-20]